MFSDDNVFCFVSLRFVTLNFVLNYKVNCEFPQATASNMRNKFHGNENNGPITFRDTPHAFVNGKKFHDNIISHVFSYSLNSIKYLRFIVHGLQVLCKIVTGITSKACRISIKAKNIFLQLMSFYRSSLFHSLSPDTRQARTSGQAATLAPPRGRPGN